MTLRHMRIFVSVYRLKSITRAAEELYMTQPAVTRAVQELEKHYGVKLFERIGRGLCATQAGEKMYADSLHILDSFERMERRVSGRGEPDALFIGASSTVGRYRLPWVMAEMERRHEGLEVRARVTDLSSLRTALLNGEVDFAAAEGAVSHPLLLSERIGGDELVPVLPPQCPLKNTEAGLEEILALPLLAREKGSAARDFLDSVLAAAGAAREPRLESNAAEALVNAAAAGLGVAFLPAESAAEPLRAGIVSTCRVRGVSLCRDWYLLRHARKFLTDTALEAMALFRGDAAPSFTEEKNRV